MRSEIFKAAAALVGTAAVALAGAATAGAGSGVGAAFNLGEANTVNATSALTGNSANGAQLRVANTNTTNDTVVAEASGGIGVALYGKHLTGGGAGPAVRGDSSSTAANAFSVYGLLAPTSPGAGSAAIRAESKSTTAKGYGLWASQAGAGTGVFATSVTGLGVYGQHTGTTGAAAGVQGESASAAAPGLLGKNTAGGPALSLQVNSGISPFTVNSQTRVISLNADLLDGLDSSALQKRVTGTCAAGSALRAVNGDGSVVCQAVGGGGSGWSLTGNAGTTPGANFIGTSDNKALVFKTNGSERMRVDASGNLGVGTATPSDKLDVSGTVAAHNSSVLVNEGFESTTFPPNGNWTTGSQNPWSRTTDRSYAGSASAQTPLFPYTTTSGSSYLQLDYTLPTAGRIDFHWGMQNPSNGRAFYFCVDNSVGCGSQPGERLTGGPASGFEWLHYSSSIPAGQHTFTWLMVITGSGFNDHQAWLDSVQLETTGVAVRAFGDAQQSRTAGGWAKALVRQVGGTLQHCYNSQGTSPDSCAGLSITSWGTGAQVITFPFDVDDRFVTVTAESADFTACAFNFVSSNSILVHTFTTNGDPIDRAFTLMVF